MSPPVFIILGLCIFFGAVSSLLMIVTLSTDHWEVTTWNPVALRALKGFRENESQFFEDEGFYIVVLPADPNDPTNTSSTTDYLRDRIGGIWRICDHISRKCLLVGAVVARLRAQRTLSLGA
jgi:hypothetical protein